MPLGGASLSIHNLTLCGGTIVIGNAPVRCFCEYPQGNILFLWNNKKKYLYFL